MGEKGFVSLAPWPEVEEGLRDPEAELAEEFLSSVVEDVGKILKVIRVKPRVIHLYTSSAWKREAHREILRKLSQGRTDRGEILRHLEGTLGRPKAELAPFLERCLKEARDLSGERMALLAERGIDEKEILRSSQLDRMLGVEVRIHGEDDPDLYDPQGRSRMALPLRPALYVE
jgi:leucyl-tRNA synthetase